MELDEICKKEAKKDSYKAIEKSQEALEVEI